MKCLLVATTYKLFFLVLPLLVLLRSDGETQENVLQLLYQNVHLIENVVYRLFVELGISHDSETDSDSDVYCYFVMLRNIPWSWLVLLSLLAFLPSVFFFLFNPK